MAQPVMEAILTLLAGLASVLSQSSLSSSLAMEKV
jgi:hypothetical protein